MRYGLPLRCNPGPAALLLAALAISGCESKKPPPPPPDLKTTTQDAQREVSDARKEASKGILSAIRIAGPNSREAAAARATATFDIAMAKAEGEQKIALGKCQTLPLLEVQACKDEANNTYEAAKAAAKASRSAARF